VGAVDERHARGKAEAHLTAGEGDDLDARAAAPACRAPLGVVMMVKGEGEAGADEGAVESTVTTGAAVVWPTLDLTM
jgi:hypothetical protein